MEVRFENGLGNRWMFDRMNGLFKDFGVAPRPVTVPSALRPAVDIVEDKDGYHFYFELPGLKSESVDVRIDNGSLVVAAERMRSQLPEEKRVLVAERAYGTIRRAFELPEDASIEKVHAGYKDGILEVTIEKRPEAKPVKIQVN
jgi:HSP20 family protein